MTGRSRGRASGLVLGALAGCLVLAACSRGPATDARGSEPAPSSSPGAAATSSAVPSPAALSTTTHGASSAPATVHPLVTKLLVVVVENHSLAQMRAAMPYTSSVAQRYGYADHYTATRHPSLPNYLAIASGSTHGVTDDGVPADHRVAGPTVFGAALAKGRTAGLYLDAMEAGCQTRSAGRYAVKHNPWAYFVDERAACLRHDRPFAEFGAAAREGRLPDAGMVVPDLCHDAHDCSLATADRWFRALMDQVVAGPDWRSGQLAVVLTADEDDRTAGNLVLTVVAHPSLSHVVVHTPLTHYSLTRLYAEVTGAPRLGQANTAPSMAAAFGLPIR